MGNRGKNRRRGKDREGDRCMCTFVKVFLSRHESRDPLRSVGAPIWPWIWLWVTISPIRDHSKTIIRIIHLDIMAVIYVKQWKTSDLTRMSSPITNSLVSIWWATIAHTFVGNPIDQIEQSRITNSDETGFMREMTISRTPCLIELPSIVPSNWGSLRNAAWAIRRWEWCYIKFE